VKQSLGRDKKAREITVMTLENSGQLKEDQEKDHEHPQPGPDVHITINRTEYLIHRGSYTVASLKTLGSVPQADDLEQNVNGHLTPLPDDGQVTIKGGEKFVSHPKDSGAS
jgi:hypothetical protein